MLPPDLSRFANLPHLKKRGPNEWSSACPTCGGKDRFRLFSAGRGKNARVWCRHCHLFEWADGEPATPERVALTRAEVYLLEQQEAWRKRNHLRQLRESQSWERYHDQMTDEHRQLWRDEGIPDTIQNYLWLGYGLHPGLQEPCLTIPYFNDQWEVDNVQYRLIGQRSDKYRFTAGLPAVLYRPEPDTSLEGFTVVVEGAKKAIVCRYSASMPDVHCVVGLPSMSPGADMLRALDWCEPIYLALDPDANLPNKDGKPSAAERVADLLGQERVRIAYLPAKPDDIVRLYGGKDALFRLIKQARRA